MHFLIGSFPEKENISGKDGRAVVCVQIYGPKREELRGD